MVPNLYYNLFKINFKENVFIIKFLDTSGFEARLRGTNIDFMQFGTE